MFYEFDDDNFLIERLFETWINQLLNNYQSVHITYCDTLTLMMPAASFAEEHFFKTPDPSTSYPSDLKDTNIEL